jgi:MFS family permease
MAIKTLWKNRPYRRILIAQSFSTFADWMFLISILALAGLTLKASSLDMSFIMLSFIIPQLLISPVAGIIADKLDRKWILVFSESGRAAVVLFVPFISEIWQLALILMTLSTFTSFFIPSKNGKIKEYLDDKNIQQGVAVSGMIDNASKIFAPSLGGLLIATLHFSTLFYMISIFYFLSVLAIISLPKDQYSKIKTESKVSNSRISVLFEGFKDIKSNPLILSGMIALASGMFFLQLIDSQLVLFLDQAFDSSSQVLGYSMAGSGLGTLLITAYLSKKIIKNYSSYYLVGIFTLGVTFMANLIFTLTPQYIGIVLIPLSFFVGGMAIGSVFITFQILVQRSIPVTNTGRIFGAISGITSLATILGLALGGIKAELLGVYPAYFVAGICLMLLSICLRLVKRRPISQNEKIRIAYRNQQIDQYCDREKSRLMRYY